MTQSEDGFPTCNRVCAHNGVDGFQYFADVLRSPTLTRKDLEAVLVSGFFEEGLSVGGGKGFEEFLVRSGDAVINFIAGCPKGVCFMLAGYN